MLKARKEILTSIKEYTDSHNYAPSIRDLIGMTSLNSPSVILHHLGVLESAGYLTRTPRIARSIQLTQKGIDYA